MESPARLAKWPSLNRTALAGRPLLDLVHSSTNVTMTDAAMILARAVGFERIAEILKMPTSDSVHQFKPPGFDVEVTRRYSGDMIRRLFRINHHRDLELQ